MSSKPAETRSITSRFVILITIAATLLLCGGLATLYWIFVQHAFEEDDEVLADRVFSVRTDLAKPSGVETVNEEIKHLHASDREAYWVRVIDATGRTTVETPGMVELLPPGVFPASVEAGSTIPRGRHHRTGEKLFALIAIIAEANGVRSTLQIAQDRSRDDKFTRRFGVLLAGVLAVGAVVAGVIAVIVTKQGLRPLIQMTRSVQRIGANRLDERVAATGWPRELQPLAIAFDEMLKRLEESFTRLSQFSADLAHELRTPVANIRGETEVSLRRSRTPEEYREVMESTVVECERLSGIIDNMLFLARAEAADRQVVRTRFDGRAALERIATYYRTIAEERNVTLTCTGEGEVYAEPGLFGRAVSNLVDNALRFTPDGGRIDIWLAFQGGKSEVAVTDNGSGISAQDLPRVFDRLYRGDASRSSQGAGLGLALVKSITELHNGSVTVRSEPGRETTITLRFPSA